jgi:hypothetical protein
MRDDRRHPLAVGVFDDLVEVNLVREVRDVDD